MKKYDASEIFQFAIRIEKNGERFYRRMSQKITNQKLKDLFTYLTDEEAKHKKLFELMVSNIEKYEPLENYSEEYFAYIRSLADNIIFDEKMLDTEVARIKDAESAIDFAIDNERASILYYQGIKNLVASNQRSSIDKIIEEEQRHFVELTDLKKLILR